MGCDIHLHIEYTCGDDYGWSYFGGQINPGRSYDLFAQLAGVRSRGETPDHISPRGFPKDASWATSSRYYLYICDDTVGEGYCTRKAAEGYLQYGSQYRDAEKTHISDPDAHSASYLSTQEYEAAIGDTKEPEYRAILAALRSFESDGFKARVVFWFDN